jgi:murein L,D-transpeptidase YcbB/YkuD
MGEVALAQAVAAYAHQASGGRIDPARISKLIGRQPEVVPAARALDETSKAADAGAQLAAYNPGHAGYRALREKLAALRQSPGPLLLAERDARRRVSDARHPAASAATKAAREASLLANMEMWRWMPAELGTDRIMVNIPEFTARLYRNDTLAAAHRIVVGKPDTPTPLFSDKMEYLVVNPSWYVPQSIIRKEMGGHAPHGYEEVWQNGLVHVIQPPGERNALGRLKFIFPNRYSVYMHDTPSRHLFAQAKRAFSHGCMRVDQPASWAVAILGADKGWTEQRIEKMYGKSERRVNLPAPLPIHIGYFTESVDESGDLRAFEDVYGYAAEVKRLLGLGV